MKIKRVWAIYFSPTHTTRRVVEAAAEVLAERLGAKRATWDFTLPEGREGRPGFLPGDAAVVGVPTYAGLVPAVTEPWLAQLEGEGIPAVPVVTYGTRDFDDALIQLRDILADRGFLPFAAGAFAGEHSFSRILAAGRPDREDLSMARQLGELAAGRLEAGEPAMVEVAGTPRPYRGRYQPRDRQGNPVNFADARPLTSESCDRCGLCVKVCPTGAIDPTDFSVSKGPCLKCGACVKMCPRKARYFDHEVYLEHTAQLEEEYARRGEVSLF